MFDISVAPYESDTLLFSEKVRVKDLFSNKEDACFSLYEQLILSEFPCRDTILDAMKYVALSYDWEGQWKEMENLMGVDLEGFNKKK